jgi:hypothetical protein
MGVYHLMGLGLSPGAVTGPVSYVAHRWLRWSEGDREFFRESGERAQRVAGDRVGDVQGLVLFTSAEVASGEMQCVYVENRAGRRSGDRREGSVRDVVRSVLAREWPALAPGRQAGSLFWCTLPRGDLELAYPRVVQVVGALAGAGKRGKEVWVSLTGGDNVVNLSLQLAAALTGCVARLYYVRAEPGTERCVRFPYEEGYWVELPALPLSLTPVGEAVLDLLSLRGEITGAELHAHLAGSHHAILGGLDVFAFTAAHLHPLLKSGLVAYAGAQQSRPPGDGEKQYALGPRWEAALPFASAAREALAEACTLEQLAGREDWLTHESLAFEHGGAP